MKRMDKGNYKEDSLIMLTVMIVLLLIFISSSVVREPHDIYYRRYENYKFKEEQGIYPNQVEEEYVLTEEFLFDEGGSTQEGSSSTVPFEITWGGCPELSAALSWQDDYGNNDHFQMVLEFEGQEKLRSSSTSGSLEILIANPLKGNYTLEISALDCPGEVDTPFQDRDNGNQWHCTVKVVRRELVEEGGGS